VATAEGEFYYWNPETNETSWDRPKPTSSIKEINPTPAGKAQLNPPGRLTPKSSDLILSGDLIYQGSRI
jgi:hypothetical protein